MRHQLEGPRKLRKALLESHSDSALTYCPLSDVVEGSLRGFVDGLGFSAGLAFERIRSARLSLILILTAIEPMLS